MRTMKLREEQLGQLDEMHELPYAYSPFCGSLSPLRTSVKGWN